MKVLQIAKTGDGRPQQTRSTRSWRWTIRGPSTSRATAPSFPWKAQSSNALPRSIVSTKRNRHSVRRSQRADGLKKSTNKFKEISSRAFPKRWGPPGPSKKSTNSIPKKKALLPSLGWGNHRRKEPSNFLKNKALNGSLSNSTTKIATHEGSFKCNRIKLIFQRASRLIKDYPTLRVSFDCRKSGRLATRDLLSKLLLWAPV